MFYKILLSSKGPRCARKLGKCRKCRGTKDVVGSAKWRGMPWWGSNFTTFTFNVHCHCWLHTIEGITLLMSHLSYPWTYKKSTWWPFDYINVAPPHMKWSAVTIRTPSVVRRGPQMMLSWRVTARVTERLYSVTWPRESQTGSPPIVSTRHQTQVSSYFINYNVWMKIKSIFVVFPFVNRWIVFFLWLHQWQEIHSIARSWLQQWQ